MTRQTVFERNPELAEPSGYAAWNATFTPVLAELREALQSRQPERLAALTGIEWAEEARCFQLRWLDVDYSISWPELVAYRAGEADACPANVQGMFLYYLATADGTPIADEWIAFRELPDGWLYHLAFQGYTGDKMSQRLGNDIDAFDRGAQALNGDPLPLGDSSYAYTILPGIRLAVVYWLGDDEFAPKAQVLFDRAAGHYLPTDGLAMLGSHLIRRILSAGGV